MGFKQLFSWFFKEEQKFNRYGWKPDVPDHRDFKASFPSVVPPPSVDLRTSPFMPPIWDQGQLGSCAAHSGGAAYIFARAKAKLDIWTPSRLAIYYNARAMENSVASDSGCMLRDVIKTLNTLGACNEIDWAYDITKFAIKPPSIVYADGAKNELTQYARVNQDENSIKQVLASGFPVMVGITLYDSFESDAVAVTGRVPMPFLSENCLGGHAVMIVGYDEEGNWIMRNSWNITWGIAGYFLLPKAYLLDENLADDFWVQQMVA
jgi:C1A family cysteine protease